MGSIVAPTRFVPSGMPAVALLKTSVKVEPLNETKSAGLTVIVVPPGAGKLTVTSKESSRSPERSRPIASILVPSGIPKLAPEKASTDEKRPVEEM